MRIAAFVLDGLPSISVVTGQYWAWPPTLFDQPCMSKCYDRLSTQSDLTSNCESDDATGGAKNMTTACMCDSFKASDLHSCMSKCPKSQKDTFAAILQGQCPDSFGGSVTEGSADEQPSSTADTKTGQTSAAAYKPPAQPPALVAGFVAALFI